MPPKKKLVAKAKAVAKATGNRLVVNINGGTRRAPSRRKTVATGPRAANVIVGSSVARQAGVSPIVLQPIFQQPATAAAMTMMPTPPPMSAPMAEAVQQTMPTLVPSPGPTPQRERTPSVAPQVDAVASSMRRTSENPMYEQNGAIPAAVTGMTPFTDRMQKAFLASGASSPPASERPGSDTLSMSGFEFPALPPVKTPLPQAVSSASEARSVLKTGARRVPIPQSPAPSGSSGGAGPSQSVAAAMHTPRVQEYDLSNYIEISELQRYDAKQFEQLKRSVRKDMEKRDYATPARLTVNAINKYAEWLRKTGEPIAMKLETRWKEQKAKNRHVRK